MRSRRLLALALLSIGVASTPSISNAAGYVHFTSKACSYTIDYPTAWKVTSTKSTDTFAGGTSGSSYIGVVITCQQYSHAVTTSRLTRAEVDAFRKQGYKTGKVTYSSGVGIFIGEKQSGSGAHTVTEIVEVAAAVHNNMGWAIVYTGDKASFKKYLSLYLHMLHTFNAQ